MQTRADDVTRFSTGLFEPVCGKDDQNYDNKCRAACSKVQVKSLGLCPDACDCSPVTKLVCGNDGNTYQNKCQAKCKGVSVKYQGNCAFGESTSTTTVTTTTIAGRKNTCEYAGDLSCDEPEFCAVGTDCKDCGNCGEPMPTRTAPPTTTSTATSTSATGTTAQSVATTVDTMVGGNDNGGGGGNDDGDACTLVKCALQCNGYCGWNRAARKCMSGKQTTKDELDDRLGDCGNGFAPGRNNTCDSAGNQVCDEGAGGSHSDGGGGGGDDSESKLSTASFPAGCSEGTDCSDCGNCDVPWLSDVDGTKRNINSSSASDDPAIDMLNAEESAKKSGGKAAIAVILVLLFGGAMIAAFVYWQKQQAAENAPGTIGSVLARASSVKVSSASTLVYGDDNTAAVHVQGAGCIYDIPMEGVAGPGVAAVTNPMYAFGSQAGGGGTTYGLGLSPAANAGASARSSVLYAVPMDASQGDSNTDDAGGTDVIYAVSADAGQATYGIVDYSPAATEYDATYAAAAAEVTAPSTTASSV